MAKTAATRSSEVSKPVLEADKRVAMASVEIGGRDLAEFGYHALLAEVRVDLADDKADYVEVILRNPGPLVTDSAIIRESNFMQVAIGYPTSVDGIIATTSVAVRRPSFSFKNPMTITLAGLGEESVLMRVKERRTYNGKTYAQIAEAVAARWQMGSMVDETDLILPQVIQSNETDYEFLNRIARKCGRTVSVEDHNLNFVVGGGAKIEVGIILDSPEVYNIDIKIEGEGKACIFASSTPDPLTGEVIGVSPGDLPDGIIDVEPAAGTLGVDDLAARRINYITCFGGTLTKEEAKNIVEDRSNRSKYVVVAHVKMQGKQWMRPKQAVVISGVGRFEGAYMIKRVLHTVKPGGEYKSEFWAVRGWTYPVGEAAAIDPQAQTSGGSLDGGQADVTARSLPTAGGVTAT